MYGMKLTPPDLRYVEFDQVVGLLGIGPLLKRTPAKLSGGEKQRVAIGRALLASPRMLLMDEPLSSLDEDRKSELIPFIARLPLQFGIPILYVSHSAREIRELADYIVTIEGGRVMDCGPASETAAKIGLHVPESRLRTVHLRGLEG
jgi:molybdate transport system ATP-binding protein